MMERNISVTAASTISYLGKKIEKHEEDYMLINEVTIRMPESFTSILEFKTDIKISLSPDV